MARFGLSAVDVDALLLNELLKTRPAELAESAAQIFIEPAEFQGMADAESQVLACAFVSFGFEYLLISKIIRCWRNITV